MAKFLNTKKAVSEIEYLIRDADQTLVLVSPYLKLSKDFKELLTFRNSKVKITTIIFGKQELDLNEIEFLKGLRFVNLRFKEDLHAKCYLNDEKMIITSLNLYEFSMNNNKEMGVLVDISDDADKELYADALKEIEYIKQTSQKFKFTTIEERVKSQNIERHIQSRKNSNSNLFTTKGLSLRIGITSRDVNRWLVDNKFMYKKENEWFATRKGKEHGCELKQGQYGQFVVWPEEFISKMQELKTA